MTDRPPFCYTPSDITKGGPPPMRLEDPNRMDAGQLVVLWPAPSVADLARQAGPIPGVPTGWRPSPSVAWPSCRTARSHRSAARLLNADETRTRLGDGVYSGPYAAPDALMDQIFDACVADIVERLQFA